MHASVIAPSSTDGVSAPAGLAGRGASSLAAGPDYAEMMARYLGPNVMRAFADEDVTEVYVNPQDGHLRVDTRSRGKTETGIILDASRIEMFLNSVATQQSVTLGADHPTVQAELPEACF